MRRRRTPLSALARELALANRILAREGVVDAYGHVSVRHPADAARFLLSCSRSPELVTPKDIMQFDRAGEPTEAGEKRAPYLERYIHAAIYEARGDVMAVVHSHSAAVLPFAVAGAPLRPVIHTAGLTGARIPLWDIGANFGETDMLVRNLEQGRDMARGLGACSALLMRGHGCTVAAADLREAVIAAIYLQLNAAVQLAANGLGSLKYLSDGEIKLTAETNRLPNVKTLLWDYYVKRANAAF